MAINIVNASSTHNTTAKSGRSIQWIVFHYTAGTSSKAGTAKAVASMFSRMSGQASADFIVDDSTIVQYNPDLKNRYCWHCGDGSSGTCGGQCYNSNSIGIEVCSSNKAGKVTDANDEYWYFTDAALAKAKELIEYLMATYSIPLNHVIRHYDVSKKYCPGVPGYIPVGAGEAKWLAFKKTLNTDDAETVVAKSATATSVSENKVASGMQKYQNGSTSETVYQTSACTDVIGSLNPYESCYCFGKVVDGGESAYLVCYLVDGTTNTYKCGYCRYNGKTTF